jgi:sodium/potassium-transporting ATPase subunit alpha
MRQQGFGFNDLMLAYNNWTGGFHGYTMDQLTEFVNVGQCV